MRKCDYLTGLFEALFVDFVRKQCLPVFDSVVATLTEREFDTYTRAPKKKKKKKRKKILTK